MKTNTTTEDWSSLILRDFAPGLARLTLIADPDRLLLEESILQKLAEHGFEVLLFGDDPLSFRYAYENLYRRRWDNGETVELVVVRSQSFEAEPALPYDLASHSRRLAYTMSDLFPNFSYNVLSELERSYLGRLYELQVSQPPRQKLSSPATRDYLLKYLFQFIPETIQQPAQLLQALLRKHYAAEKFPPTLDAYLVQHLSQSEAFRDWPLAQIIPDRTAFFQFLQTQWPRFLENWLAQPGITLDEDSQLRLAWGHFVKNLCHL